MLHGTKRGHNSGSTWPGLTASDNGNRGSTLRSATCRLKKNSRDGQELTPYFVINVGSALIFLLYGGVKHNNGHAVKSSLEGQTTCFSRRCCDTTWGGVWFKLAALGLLIASTNSPTMSQLASLVLHRRRLTFSSFTHSHDKQASDDPQANFRANVSK